VRKFFCPKPGNKDTKTILTLLANFNHQPMNNYSFAGNNDPGSKSDCYVSFELRDSGGKIIDIKSKVLALYGKSIRKLAEDMLVFFHIEHAHLDIVDTGALDFVMAARIEAAIREKVNTQKEYLLPQKGNNNQPSLKEQFRFSRLYLPGNSPNLMINAGIHHPNGLILDLEDAVAPSKKVEARFLVRNALRNLNFYGAERMVRINQIPKGLDDLKAIVPQYPNLILLPKCESANDLILVNQAIVEIKKEHNMGDFPIWLMPIIESAKGVLNAYEIACSANNVVAMAIGLEDYSADLGTQRTHEGKESFFARSMVVNAARAAGIQAIDSVFSDVSDMEALAENVKTSKGLGFDGMGCIHPRQIQVIHDNFAPEPLEIDKAKKIVLAFKEAERRGLGVVSLGTKMIDAPVVKRAQRTIQLATESGKLAKDWEQHA